MKGLDTDNYESLIKIHVNEKILCVHTLEECMLLRCLKYLKKSMD